MVLPYTFVQGTTANPTEVNSNFDYVDVSKIFYESFFYNTIDSQIWSINNLNGGVISVENSKFKGVTGVAGNAQLQLHSKGRIYFQDYSKVTGEFTLQITPSPPTTLTSAATYYSPGFHNQVGGTADAAVISWSGTGTTWVFTTQDGTGTETTNFSMDFSSLRVCIIEITSSSARLYIDGSLIATHTTRVPRGNQNIEFNLGMKTDGAGGSSITMYSKYIRLKFFD